MGAQMTKAYLQTGWSVNTVISMRAGLVDGIIDMKLLRPHGSCKMSGKRRVFTYLLLLFLYDICDYL